LLDVENVYTDLYIPSFAWPLASDFQAAAFPQNFLTIRGLPFHQELPLRNSENFRSAGGSCNRRLPTAAEFTQALRTNLNANGFCNKRARPH
jgi:hypothetical protein